MPITHTRKVRRKPAVIGIALAIMISAGLCAGHNAQAQTAGGFSIRAIIPENQIDQKQTYFDLRMQPGERQTVELVVINAKTEPLTVSLRLNAASTGRNGLIVYTEPDIRDDIMKTAITDVAAMRTRELTIPAQSSETVLIDIAMPDEPFDGLILGGIAVTGIEPEPAADEAQTISLKNQFTYVTALKLTETDTDVSPDFALTGITPGLTNYKTSVTVALQNKAARIVQGMTVTARVFAQSSDVVLYELILPDAEMAPLSTGNFVIDWKNTPLEKGTYRLKMSAEYQGRLWEWDETFTIGGEAGEINNAAVGIKKDYFWWYTLSGAGALLILLALVWMVAYRTGKREKTVGDA